MTAGLPLMKGALIPLAKSVLLPSGLSAGMSAANAAIQKKKKKKKKIHRLGHLSEISSRTTELIISNKQMEDIMKIVKLFEESGLLTKDVNKTVKNEAK